MQYYLFQSGATEIMTSLSTPGRQCNVTPISDWEMDQWYSKRSMFLEFCTLPFTSYHDPQSTPINHNHHLEHAAGGTQSCVNSRKQPGTGGAIGLEYTP